MKFNLELFRTAKEAILGRPLPWEEVATESGLTFDQLRSLVAFPSDYNPDALKPEILVKLCQYFECDPLTMIQVNTPQPQERNPVVFQPFEDTEETHRILKDRIENKIATKRDLGLMNSIEKGTVYRSQTRYYKDGTDLICQSSTRMRRYTKDDVERVLTLLLEKKFSRLSKGKVIREATGLEEWADIQFQILFTFFDRTHLVYKRHGPAQKGAQKGAQTFEHVWNVLPVFLPLDRED